MDDDELRALGPAGPDPARRAALRASVLDAIEADEALRRSGPAAPAAERRAALRASVLDAAASSAGPDGPPADVAAAAPAPDDDPRWAPAPAPAAPPGRRTTLLRAAAVVVAIAAVAATAWALAAGRGPDEVGTTPAAPTTVPEAIDIRALDLGVELDAELITCIASESPTAREFDLYASAAIEVGDVTMEAIRKVCQTDIEADPYGADRKLGFEICRDPTVDFPRPIQLLGGGTCDQRDLVAFTDEDLAGVNAARQDEAALQVAVADLGPCPSPTEVVPAVAAVLTERDADLELVDQSGAADACHGLLVSWSAGTATVAPTG